MKFQIITGDIFECSADALVFPASNSPKIYGTLDMLVYKKAGEEELLKARKNIGRLENGEADITDSFDLKGKYKYLIHTSIPSYKSGHSYHKMKDCYINSLRCAEEKQLKSVVFPVLGAGASHFPYDWAVEIAGRAVKQYSEQYPNSSISNVTLVRYVDKKQYNYILSRFQLLMELEKNNIPSEFISANSTIGKKAIQIGEELKQEIITETDRLYLQYKNEKAEYVDEKLKEGFTNTKDSDLYKEFDDNLYREIFERYMKMRRFSNGDLAEIIGIEDSDVSKIRNITTKGGKPYRQAVCYLNHKDNVIRLGLALELSFDDLCRFVWSRNHSFPTDNYDFELIEQMKKEDKEYSEYETEYDF